MTTLAFHNTGLLLKYQNGYLRIEDLNPDIKTDVRMSRWEMFVLGLRAIFAAVKP